MFTLMAFSAILILWGAYLWGYNTKYDPTLDATSLTGIVGLFVVASVFAVAAAWKRLRNQSGRLPASIAVILATLALVWIVTKGSNSAWVILDLCEAIALGGAAWGYQTCRSSGDRILWQRWHRAAVERYMAQHAAERQLRKDAEHYPRRRDRAVLAVGLCAYAVRAARAPFPTIWECVSGSNSPFLATLPVDGG